MQIAFIDHYDSFSFNVLDWLIRSASEELAITHIMAHDETGLARLKNKPIPTVISPGPGKPQDYPLTLNLLKSIVPKMPVLGICLGHQMLAKIAGGEVKRAESPWHGTLSPIRVIEKNWLTKDISPEFNATCYNSLAIDLPANPLADWKVLAVNQYEEIMILSHAYLPVASMQFHPESFRTEHSSRIAKNFFDVISRR